MPGLSGRFNTLMKAKVSSVLDRAEDPGEALDYGYEKQLELLQQAKSGIVEVVASKKRLQQQEGTLREQISKLDGQARQALVAGNEDLSRQALMRKQAIQDELGSLDQQVADLEHQQQQLIDGENRLHAKVQAFRTQKEVVKAQYSAADAQVQISSAATGVGEQIADVGMAVQRAMDKTENMKARADAVGELEQAGTLEDPMQLGSGGDDLDHQLAQLTSSSEVDSELERMKAELSAGSAPPQLGSGGAGSGGGTEAGS
jgi:phage shock protein A